jgi:putative tryptophan/tyrosine transport system substrate-binding protein
VIGLSRRQLVQSAGALGLGLLTRCGQAPFSSPSQTTSVHQVAYLAGVPPSAENTVLVSAFLQGMNDLGYVEGQNLRLEQRNANNEDELAAPAAELVRLQPEVILAPSTGVAAAALVATRTIPIVSTGAGDLVASGLAASYPRPGGTVTGLTRPSLIGKQLQLFQESVPTLARVAILGVASSLAGGPEPYEAAARALGLHLHFVGGGGPEDLEAAFQAVTGEYADGVLLAASPVIVGNQARIAELAMQRALPTMWPYSDAVGRGGLMAYGANRAGAYRRAAYYVDRILKGAKPADLPIEQPREFDFLINLKTAQALGLTIPPHVLLQATEVIQ